MSVSDRILAAVRVAVAVAVGFVLTWAAERAHFVITPHTSALIQGAVQVAVTVAYHQAVSWLQRQWPTWTARWPVLRYVAWLVALMLGSAQQPVAYRRPVALAPGR